MKSPKLLSVAIIALVLLMTCTQTEKSALEIGVTSLSINYPITPVLIGKQHNPVLQIKIAVNRMGADSLTIEGLSISTKGTSNLSDIQSIQVFKAADLDQFISEKEYEVSYGKDRLEFKEPPTLSDGVNYFWIACRLNEDAKLSNKIQLACNSVFINGLEIAPTELSHPVPKRIGYALKQQGDDEVNTYRIPGLTTTNTGTLIGVYDVRRNSAVDLQEDIDIGMSRSADGGQTWEPMRVVMDMGEWGGKPQNQNGIGDPSILVDRQTNTVWVAGIWAHGHPDERNWFASGQGLSPLETSQFMLVQSKDDGITWSEPINITTQIKDPRWHLLLAGPGKGICLRDGTLVFPAQYKDENQVPHATLIYSKDHGLTWNIGSGLRKETTEAQVVELDDGTIMINARNNEARDKLGIGRVVATTSDLGKTWSEHASSIRSLEESTCMASLIQDEFKGYGRVMLFSNPNTHSGRFNITIKSSLDEGMSWPEEKWLLLDQGDSFGYSCMTRIGEKAIGILYEGSQAHMTFEQVTIKELLSHDTR